MQYCGGLLPLLPHPSHWKFPNISNIFYTKGGFPLTHKKWQNCHVFDMSCQKTSCLRRCFILILKNRRHPFGGCMRKTKKGLLFDHFWRRSIVRRKYGTSVGFDPFVYAWCEYPSYNYSCMSTITYIYVCTYIHRSTKATGIRQQAGSLCHIYASSYMNNTLKNRIFTYWMRITHIYSWGIKGFDTP